MLLQLPIAMTSVLYHVDKTFGVSGNKTSQLLFCVKLYLQSTVQLTFEMSRFPLRVSRGTAVLVATLRVVVLRFFKDRSKGRSLTSLVPNLQLCPGMQITRCNLTF